MSHPHPALAALSDVLFRVTLGVYAAAMLAFIADLAFARRGLVRSHEQAVAVPEKRALVGAGAPVADAPSYPSVPVDVPPPSRRLSFGTAALALTAVGWLVHLVEVVSRGIGVMRMPWGNMYEFSSAICLVAVGAFLVLTAQKKVAHLGVFVMVPVVLYLGLAGTVLYAKAEPLQPVLNSYWLIIHVAAAITATGVLMVSGVVSSVHLARRRFERLVSAGLAPGFSAVTRSLPDARTLDRVEYRIIAFGFPIWTFAVMAGAIWAEAAWGHYWQWDPKETWALITWIVYAAYLHARSTPGLRKWAAHISTLAFATMIVNYYVINIFIVGKHSYAGIPH
ncbi:c-type cytochrome biogenesis protein CcsB [Acidothermaceae bacterium B102]|nr:c-type cytochrome biogenesis protein CcsB [Acidothermaceae bacterium B102]